MRSHGVPNFPDPSGGGGFNLNGTGINPQSPSFESAQQRCFKLLPAAAPARIRRRRWRRLFRYPSACGDTVFPAFPIRR